MSTLYSEVVAVGKNWYRNEMWIWLSHEINHDLIGCECSCLHMCLYVYVELCTLRGCQLKNELFNKINSIVLALSLSPFFPHIYTKSHNYIILLRIECIVKTTEDLYNIKDTMWFNISCTAIQIEADCITNNLHVKI